MSTWGSSCNWAVAAICAALLTMSSLAMAQTPSPNETFDVIIGTMCIGDLPESARTYTGRIQQGADFFRKWTVDWEAPSLATKKRATSKKKAQPVQIGLGNTSSRPIIRFFRNTPTGALGSTCRSLKGDVILSGDIDRIRLNAVSSVFKSGQPAFLRIDPTGLSVTVGHVQSGLATLFGGTINLAGSKAWIEHSEQLLNIEGQPPQGAIEITSWARRLKGAHFVIQEGESAKSFDMSSLRENVTIRVPLTGATTELFEGGFKGDPPEISVPTFSLPAISFKGSMLDIGAVTVSRFKKKTILALSRTSVRYQAARATTKQSSLIFQAAGLATIDQLEATVPPSGPSLQLRTPALQGLVAKGSDCKSKIAGESFIETGRCYVSIASADDRTAEIKVNTEEVKATPFSFVFKSLPSTTVSYSVNQAPDADTFSARMTPLAANVGKVGFDDLKDLVLAPTKIAGGSVRIPISISIPKGTGGFSFTNEIGTVSAKGALNEFKVAGVFVISPEAPSPWALQIPKGSLSFSGSSLVTSEPILYGGRPQFAGIGIAFTAISDLTIAKQRAEGLILFTPDLTTILDPKISLGRSSEGITFKAPAYLEAKASLSIDIRNGSVNVETGQLRIENAMAIVEPDHPATVGDVKIEDGSVQFVKLQATFLKGLGRIEVEKLQATAKRLSSVPRAEGGKMADQVSWSGVTKDAFRSDFIAAEAGRDEKNGNRLKLEHVVIRNTCVGVTDATVGKDNAFIARGKSLQICVKVWSDDELKGKLEFRDGAVIAEADDVQGRIRIPAIDLAITGGSPAQPSGTGTILTTNVSASATTNIDPKFRCNGVPDFQLIKAATDVSAAGGAMAVTLTNGLLSGGGGISFFNGHLHNTAQYDCRGEILDWKLWNAVKIKTYVWCPTWSKPGRTCLKELTVIPEGRVTIDSRTKVYSLTADLSALNPQLRINQEGAKTKIKACPGKFVQATPVIVASYTFQPRTPVPAFDRFVGDLTGYVAAPFETILLTGIANTLTQIATFVNFIAPKTFCTK